MFIVDLPFVAFENIGVLACCASAGIVADGRPEVATMLDRLNVPPTEYDAIQFPKDYPLLCERTVNVVNWIVRRKAAIAPGPRRYPSPTVGARLSASMTPMRWPPTS